MRGHITLRGVQDLNAKLQRLEGAMPRLIADSLMVGVLPLNDRWKENILTYPLVRTGTYMRSVHAEVLGTTPTGAEVMVGTNLTDPPYPYYLEFGTWSIAPKGVARNAFDATTRQVVEESQRAFQFLLARVV